MGRVGAGTTREELAQSFAEAEARLLEMLAVYRERMDRPHVTGQDLIEAGEKPGPSFGEALAYAHKLRLAGRSKDEQLRNTLGWMRSREARAHGQGGG
jgi:hypothetical protein